MKCKKCKGTGRILPDQPCMYNCELGGTCPDTTPLHCFLCGTITCNCRVKPSKNSFYSEISKKIIKFKEI